MSTRNFHLAGLTGAGHSLRLTVAKLGELGESQVASLMITQLRDSTGEHATESGRRALAGAVRMYSLMAQAFEEGRMALHHLEQLEKRL